MQSKESTYRFSWHTAFVIGAYAELVSERWLIWNDDGRNAGVDYSELEFLIRSYLARAVEDGDDLADLTQECLIKIWRRGDTFQGRSAFSSWVYRLVHNEFLSWTRRRARRDRQRLRWADVHQPEVDDRLEGAVLSRVTAYRLLEHLSERDRDIVKRRYLDGWTSVRIGSELGLAPSSVRCRILRVRAAHLPPAA